MAFWTASELQLSLIAFGAAAVAVVWIYNKWQEFRLRRRAERAFRGEHADALLGGTAPAASAAEEAHEHERGRIEPVFAEQDSNEDYPSEPPFNAEIPTELPQELADPAVDCLLSLTLSDPLAAPSFWAAQAPLLGAFEGRLRWLGEDRGTWRQLSAHDAASYRRFVAALPLADRSGPLGELELSRLFAAINQLADDIRALSVLPDAADILAQAHELDVFCASVDWRIALNVVSRIDAAMDGRRLAAQLEAAGFLRQDDGLYHAEDSAGQTQFTVGSLGGLPLADEDAGVTLTIDVPLVSDGVAALDRLLAFARQLMAAEDASLVDDQRAPLGESALAAIRAKIGEFQQKMAAQGIPAGGRRAMRLYS
jgi:hypothetical protein